MDKCLTESHDRVEALTILSHYWLSSLNSQDLFWIRRTNPTSKEAALLNLSHPHRSCLNSWWTVLSADATMASLSHSRWTNWFPRLERPLWKKPGGCWGTIALSVTQMNPFLISWPHLTQLSMLVHAWRWDQSDTRTRLKSSRALSTDMNKSKLCVFDKKNSSCVRRLSDLHLHSTKSWTKLSLSLLAFIIKLHFVKSRTDTATSSGIIWNHLESHTLCKVHLWNSMATRMLMPQRISICHLGSTHPWHTLHHAGEMSAFPSSTAAQL